MYNQEEIDLEEAAVRVKQLASCLDVHSSELFEKLIAAKILNEQQSSFMSQFFDYK